MSTTKLRRLLSFFCCLCFITALTSGVTEPMVRAATSSAINVKGYSSINESTYNYETDGTAAGTMSVSYKIGDDGQETTCAPDRGGKITDIPTGANVTFALEPKSGFNAGLKINNQSVDVTKTDDNKYTGTIIGITATETDVEAFFTSQNNSSENIVVNLKYLQDEQLQNGTYNGDFKTKWATIEYSTDGGTTYSPLDQGTTVGDNGSYSFDASIDSISLRLTWENKVMAMIDTDLAQSGAPVTLTKGSHTVVFQEAIYTVAWLYVGESTSDETAITKHGKISIEKADGIDGQEDSTGGIYTVTPGTQVTMHFIPDYGYQFTKSDIDDLEITPGTDECTYTFTMPEDYVIIGDIFTENPDAIDISASSIVAASILNASDVVSSGNASLNVADSVMTQDKKDKITSFATEKDLSPVTYLDVELSKFLTKGATGEKWETLMPETSSPIKLTLTLGGDLKGADSYTVMQINGDEITPLETAYNVSEGTLQFETNKISQFVIAKNVPPNAISSFKKIITGDPNKLLLYSMIMLAAAAGFALTFISLKKNNKKFKI